MIALCRRAVQRSLTEPARVTLRTCCQRTYGAPAIEPVACSPPPSRACVGPNARYLASSCTSMRRQYTEAATAALAWQLPSSCTLQRRVFTTTHYHLQPTPVRQFSGVTGIAFQPIPENDLAIMKWQKKQEIKQRVQQMLRVSEEVWASQPDRDYRQITHDRARQWLHEYFAEQRPSMDPPTGRETRQFYRNTLTKFAPWRLHEEEAERKTVVQQHIDSIFDDIRQQLAAGKTVELTKNDITMQLEDRLGELPTADEVDWLWRDRYRLPRVTWIGAD